MSAQTNNPEEQKFAVFAEAEGYNQPLIMHDLSFGRLMDEVVVPYQSDEPFFIDGVPLKKGPSLRKMKILRLNNQFGTDFWIFNTGLKRGDQMGRVFGDQYHIRIEAILRENGEDMTAQIIKAFDRTIKPSLKDYLSKREELIQGALQFFLNNVSQLTGLKA